MKGVDEVVFLELFRDHVDEIRGALGSGWESFRLAALPLLIRATGADGGGDATAAVNEILDRLLDGPAGPVVQRLLFQARSEQPDVRTLRSGVADPDAVRLPETTDTAMAATAAAAAEWLTATDETRYRRIPVFYATDRARTDDASPNGMFGGARGELTFGEVRVSIPERHVAGHVERPLPLFAESPEKHVALLDIRQTDAAGLLADLGRALEIARAPKLLMFVHGYRVPFAEAARVAAQVASDINFTGVPMLYSWPSKGRLFGYTADEADAMWTREHFVQTIDMLGTLRVGALKAVPTHHLLAHSMGNRVVFQGLQFVQGERFGQVVMAAPDEDADTLDNQMPRFLGHAERTTLYCAEQDKALATSRILHGHARGGQVGAAGVDTIDASAVNFSLFAHSYFHEQRSLLSDIYLLLEHGMPPEQRPLLRRSDDRGVWRFQA